MRTNESEDWRLTSDTDVAFLVEKNVCRLRTYVQRSNTFHHTAFMIFKYLEIPMYHALFVDISKSF